MKAFFATLLFVIAFASTQANSIFIESLREKLTLNTWLQADANEWTGFNLMMEFQNNGQVRIVCSQAGEWPALGNYNWNLSEEADYAVLTLRDAQQVLRYALRPSADGIDLVPFQSEFRSVVHLRLGAEVNPLILARKQQALQGAWENTMSNDSDFQDLRFNADGTFSRRYSNKNATATFTEYGRWSLSQDGEYLIMLPHDSDQIEYAKVCMLNGDELVFELLQHSKGHLMPKKEAKKAFFNKL
jgi:hypothetical protein